MSITPQELEELRVRAGFKYQTTAAREIGVDSRTYQRWVAGGRRIPEVVAKYFTLLIAYNELKEKDTSEG